MASTSNIKDTLTTIFGIVGSVSGSVLTAVAAGLVVPPIVKVICGVVAAISLGVIGFLTGKAPNAAVKTGSQVVAQNIVDPQTK